jgi:hypothetical protein
VKILAVIFIFFCALTFAALEKYPLQEFTTTTEINGIKVDVKSQATVGFAMTGDSALVKIEAIADLRDFQNKAGDIIRAALNEDEECSHKIAFPDVQLSPDNCSEGNCKSAKMRLYGDYENKKCLFGHEKTILKQSFDCDVLLFPEIANNKFQIRSEVNDFNGSGVLGKLMSIDAIKGKIVSSIESEMKAADESLQSSMDVSFPEEVKDLHPKFTSVTFQEDGKHALLLRIEAEIVVPREQSDLILQQITATKN